MKMTTLTRRLPALLLVLAAGQVSVASAASAQGGLLGTGLFAPPAPAPTPVVAAAAPAPVTLLAVEQKLAALHYEPGDVDGKADDQLVSAITAFQKVNGLERTGGLSDQVTNAIMATQTSPPALVPNGEPNRVEVSLAKQVLFLYEGGNLTKILAVSTGTSATPTPTGSFRFYRSDPGWHTSALGRLYNAQYFVGGYAVHGSLSIPTEPASHGCIRISMYSAETFPSHVTKGMQIVVLAG
jgi:lipoprotein-anchoring transpeptidase ErfK/SrfK